MTTQVRPYRGTDEAGLVRLWNASMIYDRINVTVLRTRVLLDPNLHPDTLLVAADNGGAPAGFVLAIRRRVPLFLQGLEPELGWITAFGVLPERRRQGIGRRLFAAALDRLAAAGCRTVLIAPYTPNYFIPGVDPDAYPEAMKFLEKLGWEQQAAPVSMRAELTGFQIPLEVEALAQRLSSEGIEIRPVTAADLPDLMPFIAETFSWDWYRFAQEYLLELFGRGADDLCFLVAVQGGRIVGYCQQRRERFGPFGVHPSLRNQGIGRVLLFRCLADMLTKGFHCAWFLWTGRDAARLYEMAGFHTVRRFAVMRYVVP
ncbi:MAG: GNAT family N-acetyltransferase [Caldilineaceae bacterium]|nr:GNAT family N-acetyltransferase [Caldilineaceae bacterium]